MGKVELYYSSEMAEPWCDIEEIRGLLGKLKEKGVSVDEIDTAKIPESELKEFYTTSVIVPSVKKKYKISGLLCRGGDEGQTHTRFHEKEALL